MKVLLFTLSFVLAVLAFAQHKLIDTNPPKAKPFMKSQLERMDIVKAHKLRGIFGEADSGLLAFNDTKGLSPSQVKRAQDILAAENKDRTAIYEAIIEHNKLKDKEKELLIRSAFEAYKNADAKGMFYFEKGIWNKKY